jgi:predicted DsbA family dithiol-disulfide isomerase
LKVRIDVWSDYACPWCALGIYRLDAALGQFEHREAVDIVHRAFELHPGAPAQTDRTMDEVVAAKYQMSPEQVRAGHDRLTALGSEVGMEFQFERIRLTNTFDAHRLARSARGAKTESALVKGLFGAYFTEGRLLSETEVLLDIAEAAGLDRGTAHEVVTSGAFGPEVRADEREAQQLEVTGVPHFLINGRWAIPGAQDIETLVLVLRRAWERTEVPTT